MGERIADKLRDQLEQDILTGVYAPGDRLDELRLATRFSVSRTPIREAFQHLAASGLVDLKPRRGAFVRRPSVTEIIEMFEVMAELEGMCGRLAARRITARQIADLKAALDACERACSRGEMDDYYYENERFHFVIYQASGNGYLSKQAMALYRRLKPYRRMQLRVRGRMRRSLEEHRSIVEAITGERAEEAERIVKSHLLIQGEGFNDLVEGLEREKGPSGKRDRSGKRGSGVRARMARLARAGLPAERHGEHAGYCPIQNASGNSYMAHMRTIFALFMPVLAAFTLATVAIAELGTPGVELSQLAPSGFELLQRQNDQTHRALQDQLRQRENQIRDRRMDEIRRKSEETRRFQSMPPGTTQPYAPVAPAPVPGAR